MAANSGTLCVETSTSRAYLAIRRHSDLREFAATIEPGRKHGRDLLPSIRGLLLEAELTVAELGMIHVGLGPGSYTGLRVGVTAAKTLAYATGAGLGVFNSLEFFARGAPTEALRVVAISDAQRGDFHVSELHRVEPHAPLMGTEPAVSIEDRTTLANRLAARIPVHVIGPGLDRWDGDWPQGAIAIPNAIPSPLLMLDIVHGLTVLDRQAAFALEPIYLRRSAAEDLWERRPK